MSDSLIPPSITGKGSHFPPGGSVLDHAFGQSDPYTLGVEEEYMLLDGETFDLVQHIDTVLAAVAGHELEPRINSELMQSVLEVATPVCHTPADVQQQLLRIRALRLRRRAGEGHARRLGGHASVLALRARSGSPRRTAIARSSTRCSTSRGAS